LALPPLPRHCGVYLGGRWPGPQPDSTPPRQDSPKKDEPPGRAARSPFWFALDAQVVKLGFGSVHFAGEASGYLNNELTSPESIARSRPSTARPVPEKHQSETGRLSV